MNKGYSFLTFVMIALGACSMQGAQQAAGNASGRPKELYIDGYDPKIVEFQLLAFLGPTPAMPDPADRNAVGRQRERVWRGLVKPSSPTPMDETGKIEQGTFLLPCNQNMWKKAETAPQEQAPAQQTAPAPAPNAPAPAHLQPFNANLLNNFMQSNNALFNSTDSVDAQPSVSSLYPPEDEGFASEAQSHEEQKKQADAVPMDQSSDLSGEQYTQVRFKNFKGELEKCYGNLQRVINGKGAERFYKLAPREKMKRVITIKGV